MLTDKECEAIADAAIKASDEGATVHDFIRAGYAAALAAREQEPPFKTDVCGVCWHCGGALLSDRDCPAFAHPAPARSQDERKGEA